MRFFREVLMRQRTMRVWGSSRSSRTVAGGNQTVGKLPMRSKFAKPLASSLSVLLMCPIMSFAFAGGE